MTTPAQIAAGRAFYELKMGPYGSRNRPWESIEYEDERAAWIKDAMAIVRAYQRAAWREPTAEEIKEYKPLLKTYCFKFSDGWSPWAIPAISTYHSLSNEFDVALVQDLPPLPEPRL